MSQSIIRVLSAVCDNCFRRTKASLYVALISDANEASLTTYEFVHGRITGPSTEDIGPQDRRSRPAGHPMTRVGYPACISEAS
jgi:hypothetical protein